MCAVCRKNPCDSRCPNAEEPKSIYTCEWCEEPIYEGDKYIRHECNRILRVDWRIIQNSREGGRIEWKIRQECSRQHHKRHQLFR